MRHLICQPKAMLFDLDGTLAHTLPQLSKAVCAVADDLALPKPTPEQMASFVGNGVNMLLVRMLLNRHQVTLEDVDPKLLEQARSLFFKHYQDGLSQNFELYPHVSEGMAYFHSLGIKLGVVTNKPHVFAEPLIEYMGLKPYMSVVLGGEVLPKRKPDPQPLLYALEQMGIGDTSSCLMVGDSINDVQAGHAAHMVTVAFTYGYNGGFDVKDANPSYLFNRFDQLISLIKSLPVH